MPETASLDALALFLESCGIEVDQDMETILDFFKAHDLASSVPVSDGRISPDKYDCYLAQLFDLKVDYVHAFRKDLEDLKLLEEKKLNSGNMTSYEYGFTSKARTIIG